MPYLLLGLLILAVFLLAGKSFTKASPKLMARRTRVLGGTALLAIAAVLALTGRIGLAMLAASIGAPLLGWSLPWQAARARLSRRETAWLLMERDVKSGEMRGEVRAGRFAGRALNSLQPGELRDFWAELAADPASRRLLEAYLDSRLAGWREHFQADAADRHGGAAGTGAMTDQEAYQILGLAPGAGEAEIRAAHRRLMKRVHPDQGGTAFLAAKLNEAKDKLLRGH
jgi:hypothetical protein